MAITPLPALDRTSPTFKSNVDTFFGAQIPVFVAEANALQADVNEKQVAASDAAGVATTKATQTAGDAVATAADRVQTGLDRAAALADRQQTGLDRTATGQDKAATAADRAQTGLDRQAVADGLASIASGPVYSVDGATGSVVLKTINGTALTGVGNIAIDSSIYRVARTSNTQLVAADKGKLIDITSGTFTQTFAAAATLGDGWFVYMRNIGTGVITLDPNGGELIDGMATIALHPGHARLVQCDGTALRTVLIGGDEVFMADDQRASNTSGGTAVNNATQTRVLNTVLGNTINGASLASNAITIPAGTYDISASCPSFATGSHQASLFNVTASSTLLRGTSEAAGNATVSNRSHIAGRVTLPIASVLRLDHYTSSTYATGLGVASASGSPEIYSQITIRKIA